MLTECQLENHHEPVYWFGQIVEIADRGHTRTLTMTAATVECRGESVTSDVSIRFSVNEHGHGSIAFKFSDVPNPLREAMREASERDPADPFVPFAVVDGARCDVPALPWQVLHSAEEGPVSVTLYGENLRGLVPNFGPPVAVKVPGCRHSAQSWYRKDGVLGCDDCDAEKGQP